MFVVVPVTVEIPGVAEPIFGGPVPVPLFTFTAPEPVGFKEMVFVPVTVAVKLVNGEMDTAPVVDWMFVTVPVTVETPDVADPMLVAPVPVPLFTFTAPEPVGFKEMVLVPVTVAVKLVKGEIATAPVVD